MNDSPITPSQHSLLTKLSQEQPAAYVKVMGIRQPNALSKSEASKAISDIFFEANNGQYRAGSKQAVMEAALRANDWNVDAALRSLSEKIGREKPLIFRGKAYRGAPMADLPMGTIYDRANVETQYGRARKTAFAVKNEMAERGMLDQKPEQQRPEDEQPEQEQGGGRIEQMQERQESPSLRAAKELIRWIQQPFVQGEGGLRAFCESRKADGKPIDEIGLRPAQNGAKLLREGLTVKAIKHALTMHFPPEARKALGVTDFDPTKFRPQKFEPIPKGDMPDDVLAHDGKHKALPYCLAVVTAGVPLALVGPKGTGKTTLAGQIAEELGLPFGMVSMTAGTSPSAFMGRPRISDPGTTALIQALIAAGREDDALKLALRQHKEGDVVVSQFVRIFGGGGVFLFDEMDAADENLLLLLNAALANGKFANNATGEIVEQHPDFIPVAGMNTMGVGATRDYNSRNKLDAATLDRWAAGRTQVALDEALERKIYWSALAA